jgi:hypothetical protein
MSFKNFKLLYGLQTLKKMWIMISKINDHFSSVSHSNTELIQVSHNVVIYIIGSVLSSLENLMVKKKISDINEFKV